MKKFHEITLYLSADSHLSELAREYFRQNSMDFEEVDVDKETALANEIFERAGKKETPIVEIDGRIVVGFRPDIFEILLNDPNASDVVE